VRNTASKQLAQLAAKSVFSDVAVEEDVKSSRQHVSLRDPSAWAELMAVVARVCFHAYNNAIMPPISRVSQIIPYLHSKSFETRTAASSALSQIFSLVPIWLPNSPPADSMSMCNEDSSLPPPDFPMFSVQELMEKGKLLLASSGKEFQKPIGILSSATEVKKARKEAMGRLGLDFLESVGGTDEMDIEKELAAGAEPDDDAPMEPNVKTEEQSKLISPTESTPDVKLKIDPTLVARAKSGSPPIPTPTTANAPSEDRDLSARELNRLKRKRKPGNLAFVAAPPPQPAGAKYNPAPAAQPTK
jgi:TATA-binding protein-associated factor